MDRRHFLMSTAAAAPLAASALGSPNDTVRVAVVGCRGQGNSHIRQYLGMKNVEIAALCDVDDSVLNQRLAFIEKESGKKPAAFKDLRLLLEDKSIDAISIATPNHQHTLQTIWSLQAGKHVYCEKPCSHNIFESRQIVAATRKYNKLVQHGTNSRSTVALQEGMKKLADGYLGEVYMARGLCFKWRDTINRTPVEAVPAGVDYDLWLGPAPKREYTKNRFHYNWHWFWDYGNGDFGNQGIHEVDIARWGLGATIPTKVSAMGGHFMFDDDQETPNVLTCTYEFNVNGKKKFMVFDVRHWITNNEATIGSPQTNTVGNIFYGSKGVMSIDGYAQYETFLTRKFTPGDKRKEGGSNWQNFIDALRSGKREDLNAEIQEGAYSSTLMHLANISYRLGRTLDVDPVTGDVKNDKEAMKMHTRNYRKGFEVPLKV